MANGPFNFNTLFHIPPGGFVIAKFLSQLFDKLTGHNHDGVNSCPVSQLSAGAVDGITILVNGNQDITALAPLELVSTVTLAQINAGQQILADNAANTLRPVGISLLVNGLFAAGTSVTLADSAGIVIMTIPVANLTAGAWVTQTTAGITIGAGMLAALTSGKGFKVTKTGSAFTGGTSIVFAVRYLINQ
jgi:hypothetical protein